METLNVVETNFAGVPASTPINTLDEATRAALAKTAVGKALLAHFETSATLDGFTAPSAKVRTPRVKRDVPAGHKFCHDCYKRGLAADLSDEDAVQFAIKPETDFAKAGKAEDGTQKYGNYCKTDTNLRTAANQQKNANKNRIAAITETYLPNAEKRVAELKAELAQLQAAVSFTEEAESEDITTSEQTN